MCGIVGYISKGREEQFLIQGLKRLEYRGYDSVGISVFEDGKVITIKSAGRVDDLEKKLKEIGVPKGVLGIGHTRWATHGEPSDVNSHPHSCGKVTLVHNGIIENYSQLKAQLLAEGRTFVSATDTEIVAHLIDKYYWGDPASAIFTALAEIRGSYALGIFFSDIPDTLYAVRKDSPLIVGIGEEGNYIASDILALIGYTNKYCLLDTNELAIITTDTIKFLGYDQKPVFKEIFTATCDVTAAEKGGYPHFMLKEIYEQPKALSNTIFPRLSKGISCIFEDEIGDFAAIDHLYIVACGSALHAGMVGKHFIEKLCKIPVQVEIASEFRYQNLIFRRGDAIILISQSGETADTLAALRIAKQNNVPTIAIVNVVGSTIAREADTVLYTRAGPEIAVATTKAYTCQIAVLLLLALRMAYEKKTCDIIELEKYAKCLNVLPDVVENALAQENLYKDLAYQYKDSKQLFYIGRGIDCALCWEASIKLKEITYIHSEAYAAGELKHGTISLIEPGIPVIAIATCDALFEKTLSNIKEVKARGAKVILITREGHELDPTVYDDIITLPAVDEFIRPIAAVVPLQMFAYYIALAKGFDIDKPRNLAKSVTVE